MKQSQYRLVGLASLLLMVSTSFVACGGLDPRKVTRGPDYSSGGDEPTGGTDANTGGTESGGGEPNVNPFGGAFEAGGAPVVVDGPPEVVEVNPPDAETDVDVSTNVSFLFNEAVTPDTVTNDSVKLLLGGVEVPGDVSLSNNVISTFEPARRLALATQYETSVSIGVTDTTNQPLKEAFSSSFITRDGAWEADDPPLTNPEFFYNYDESKSGIDGRGNVLVVWPQAIDEVSYEVALFGRWHRQTSGWQPIIQLSEPGVDSGSFDVAVNPDGDAVVVWRQYDSVLNTTSVGARRFLGGTWEEAAAASGVDTYSSVNDGPYVSMAGGMSVVYYYARSSTYDIVFGTSAPNDGGWPESPAALEYVYSTSTFTVDGLQLAQAPTGNAMLIYNRNAKMTNVGSMYFAKFLASNQTWEYPADVPVAAAIYAYSGTAVALDNDGAAMVIWTSLAAPYDLWASRYTKAKGFAPAVKLDDLDDFPGTSFYQDALVTDGTDFYVAWGQTVGSTMNAYASRFSTADGMWSGAELVSSGDASLYGYPMITADAQKNVTLAWTNQQTYEIYYTRFLAYAGTWTEPDLVATGKGYELKSLRAASNGIVGLLSQSDGYTEGLPGQPYLHVFQ